MRMEQRIYTQKGVRQRATKVERFDDDYKAEKRQMGRVSFEHSTGKAISS